MLGATDTNFFHRAGMDDTKAGVNEKDDPALVAQQGLEVLMAGKDAVIASSLKTKFQGNCSGSDFEHQTCIILLTRSHTQTEQC